MEPIKLPKTYREQLAILKKRGLEIGDEAVALGVLSRVNYFRMISAYSLSLYEDPKSAEPRYKKGTTFHDIYDLYCFDTKLRQILSELVEPFELAIKTQLSYFLAHKYCATCYLRRELFEDDDHFDSFQADLKREKKQQSHSKIMSHHQDKYNGILPIWAATEVLSFGEVAKLYQNLNRRDKQQFAKENYHVGEEYLSSWLRCFVGVRNICAHYGRLYYRNLEAKAKFFKEEKYISNYKIFSVVYLLFRQVPDGVLKMSLFLRLKYMIATHTAVNLDYIGFPADWEAILIRVGDLQDAFAVDAAENKKSDALH